MTICIQNGDLVLPDRIEPNGTILIQGPRIAYAGPPRKTPAGATEIDARRGYVAPGLIEMHFHCAGPYSLDPPDETTLLAQAEFLLRRGITHFLPTMMADENIMRQTADLILSTGLARRALGIYPEGPFINIEKRGGVLPEYIRPVDIPLLLRLQKACRGQIRIMTFAPELDGAHRLPPAMRRLGIIPSIGHSAATCQQALRAAGRARINCTHLFNAMSGLHHHHPGVAAFALDQPNAWVELNADGAHVAPEMLRLTWRAKPHDRIALISDAVVSAGGPPGEYHYMGKTVVADRQGVYRKEDRTLVGSRCLINEILTRFQRFTGAPLHDAVRLASLNPARLLGIARRTGSLEPGKEANIAIFRRNFSLARAVFLRGQQVI